MQVSLLGAIGAASGRRHQRGTLSPLTARSRPRASGGCPVHAMSSLVLTARGGRAEAQRASNGEPVLERSRRQRVLFAPAAASCAARSTASRRTSSRVRKAASRARAGVAARLPTTSALYRANPRNGSRRRDRRGAARRARARRATPGTRLQTAGRDEFVPLRGNSTSDRRRSSRSAEYAAARRWCRVPARAAPPPAANRARDGAAESSAVACVGERSSEFDPAARRAAGRDRRATCCSRARRAAGRSSITSSQMLAAFSVSTPARASPRCAAGSADLRAAGRMGTCRCCSAAIRDVPATARRAVERRAVHRPRVAAGRRTRRRRRRVVVRCASSSPTDRPRRRQEWRAADHQPGGAARRVRALAAAGGIASAA